MNFSQRHRQHNSGSEEKFNEAKFNVVLILISKYFNRSALDDVEKQLIIYFIADQKNTHSRKIDFDEDKIINKTKGNSTNDYMDRDKITTDIVLPFWEKVLYPKWVNNKSIEQLRNAALIKYSPFKELTEQQHNIISNVLENDTENFVINGDAGTGKTVLLTHLVAKLISSGEKTVAVVVQPNWEKTGKEIFKLYGLTNDKLRITTSTKLINSMQKYDIIIVDESHKLSRRGSKQMYSFNSIYEKKEFSHYSNHLYPLIDLSKQLILMYDVFQEIRPANIKREDFAEVTSSFNQVYLDTQFRIQTSPQKEYTSSDYINGIKYILFKDTGLLNENNFDSNFNRDVFRDMNNDAYFGIVENPPLFHLTHWIETDRHYNPGHVNRTLAGLFVPWRQSDGKDSSKKHFFEGSLERRWNSTQDNWINSNDNDAEDQIGSVFAVQGIDLNNVGVLLGPDLQIDNNGKIYANPDNFLNDNGKLNKEDLLTSEGRKEFTIYVLNIYYVLLTRGIDGIRIGFWNNAPLKKYFEDNLLKE